MQTVVIVIHLLIVIALVGVVLIQRSEGGGLGIGGGSGFMTARGTKNALTRLTAILAGCFFLTSIILTILQTTSSNAPRNLLDRLGDEGDVNLVVPSLTDNLPIVPAQPSAPADVPLLDSMTPELMTAPEVPADSSNASDELMPTLPAPVESESTNTEQAPLGVEATPAEESEPAE